MAAKTFTLPDGSKVTSATQRRYILISAPLDGSWKPYISKRSDKVETLRAETRRATYAYASAARQWYLGDMLTGQAVRL